MWIILLGVYPSTSPLWIRRQNRSAQCAVEWKPRSITLRCYVERLIDLNEYLVSFPGATLTDKIGVTAFNEILLNSMPTNWSKQAYVQVFDCESIAFKKSVNMFEHMEIDEYIYKGVV